MAPKNEKKEKPVKGDEAEQVGGVELGTLTKTILDYLRSVNRPYSSTDVSTNLKGKVTKPEAQKALVSLAGKGALTMKTYGKQTIFVYNQAQLPVLDPEELGRIDESLKTAKESVEDKRKQLKVLSSDVAAKESLPRTAELGAEIERINAANDVSTQSLNACRGQDAAPLMSVEDTTKIDKDWARWRKEWVSRRKVYNDLFGLIEDCGLCVTRRADFEDDQGIEHEDADAIKVQESELCRPQLTTRVPVKRKAGSASSSARGEGPGASCAADNDAPNAEKAKRAKDSL